MTWRTINGNRYFYRSRRINGRVVSEYVGAGWLAQAAEALDGFEREKRQAERAELETMAKQDQEVNAILEEAQTLAKAALLAAGWYQHKGQWRRRHDRKGN